MHKVHDPSVGAPPPSVPPMKLMDLIESDELGDLDVEFLNNEVQYMPCKDYGKGSCKQGVSCKYYHGQRPTAYAFCHKFQYSTCTVSQCKYIHASPYEQQIYYKTGKFVTYGLHHLNKTTMSLALMAGSSLANLSGNPVPKRMLADDPWTPIYTSGRRSGRLPMKDVAEIPLPVNPPVLPQPRWLSSMPWLLSMASLVRAPKRTWLAMESASNSSGDPIKRCASCDTQMG